MAAVAAFVAWLVVRHFDGTGSTPAASTASTTQATPVSATAISAQGLRTLAGALGRPIYWAGPRQGITYELTQTPDGRIYVRYLPKGVAVGSSRPYLTVGTYPVSNAYAVTAGVARRSTSVRLHVGNAVAFYGKNRPTNVYVAYPGQSFQVEVFDPSAAKARALVAGGQIESVAGRAGAAAAPTPTAVAATPAALVKVSATLGRPVYWAGRRAGTTYELTQTPDGRVYVRYLPQGVRVGASKAYLTVATYPLRNGFAVTTAAAADAGSVKLPVGNGGVAFYARSRPTSVYVAYPNADEQIEVFDPTPAAGRALVTANKVRPVP